MKRHLITLCVLMVGLCSFSQSVEKVQKHKITVKGNVKFADANNKFGITVEERNEDNESKVVKEVKLDSQNNYSFELEADKPKFYTLNVYKQQRVEFYADDENLKINFRGIDTAKVKIKNPPHVHISGGEKNNVLNALHFAGYQDYQRMIAVGKEQYKASLTDCKDWKDYAGTGISNLTEPFEREIKNIVEMHGDKPTIVKVIETLSWKRHYEYMIEHYDRLSKKFPNVEYIQKAKELLLANMASVAKTDIGKVAPDFTFPDINGKQVSLSSFKGKYVLIDFWASWCGPCRKESPNVQKQYQLYKDKGFEVVSVSIDKKIDDWKKAITQDNLKGTLLLAQDSKKIMLDYTFSGIPYMVLLDKEGKIIAKDLRGDPLQEKLKEIF
jgi:peroxiredoxin